MIYKSKNVFVSCSTRDDGNMALHTGDSVDEVVVNRKRFLKKYGLDIDVLVCMDQVHSSHVFVVAKEHMGLGALSFIGAIEDTDAVVTLQRGAVLAVLTADCVPVILIDESAGVVSAVHAGWKGTASEICKKSVEKMLELGANAANIKAFVGASIGKCCYRVGEDVANACGCSGDEYIDLKLQNALQLMGMGINEANIDISKACTSCDSDKYFSYRKDCGGKGRFMSLVGLF